jgi:hypothetical protein
MPSLSGNENLHIKIEPIAQIFKWENVIPFYDHEQFIAHSLILKKSDPKSFGFSGCIRFGFKRLVNGMLCPYGAAGKMRPAITANF